MNAGLLVLGDSLRVAKQRVVFNEARESLQLPVEIFPFCGDIAWRLFRSRLRGHQ